MSSSVSSFDVESSESWTRMLLRSNRDSIDEPALPLVHHPGKPQLDPRITASSSPTRRISSIPEILIPRGLAPPPVQPLARVDRTSRRLHDSLIIVVVAAATASSMLGVQRLLHRASAVWFAPTVSSLQRATTSLETQSAVWTARRESRVDTRGPSIVAAAALIRDDDRQLLSATSAIPRHLPTIAPRAVRTEPARIREHNARIEPAPAPLASTLPETPSRDDVAHAMASIHDAVRNCAGGSSETAVVSITFHATGRASIANTEFPFAGNPAGSCMAVVARAATLPPFARDRFTVRASFPAR